MKSLSLARKFLELEKPFVFFHTHEVSKNLLERVIHEGKSIHLDVAINDSGKAYLGHTKVYYKKTGEPLDDAMPIWEAVELVSKSKILAKVDCKHFDAWNHVERVVDEIGPERCLVNVFVSEFDFDYVSRDLDFKSEWSAIKRLRSLKNKFPLVTLAASAKGLPNDLLINRAHSKLIHKVRKTLEDNLIDSVSLNIPEETFSDKSLKYFLEKDILVCINSDNLNKTKLSEPYIGETDFLSKASKSGILKF